MLKIIITILLFNLILPETYSRYDEVFEAEVPPSIYLQELSKVYEKKSRLGARFAGFMGIGFGMLFFTSSANRDDSEFPGPEFGYAMGTASIVYGAINLNKILSNKPLSDYAKEFEKIEKKDYEEREKSAYDMLEELAIKSRLALNNAEPQTAGQELILDLFINGEHMTIEEKAYSGFKNQTPIDEIF